MANIVTAEARKLLDASLGTTAFTAVNTPMMLRLMTANGDASTAGTQVTNAGGSTYAPQSVNFGAANTSGVAANSGTVSFTNMPAVTVTGVEIWDSTGTPRRVWFGALTASKTLGLGDTISFAASALSISLG